MFRPNLDCLVSKLSGRDVYGQTLTAKIHRERCSIVTFDIQNLKSSVRADSSASRGAAQEEVAQVVILLTKNTVARIDDTITVAGRTLKIASSEPRFDVNGQLDHHRITCSAWSAT